MPTILDPATAENVVESDVVATAERIVATLEPQVARGRYGAAIRDHGEGSSEVVEARQNLIEANIAAAVRKAREGGPPLREEQVQRLVALLSVLPGEG